MKGLGPIRIVLVKYNAQKPSFSRADYYSVLRVDFFPHGFLCRERLTVDHPGWVQDEITESNDGLLDLLKDKPNGFYEIIGGFGYESWRTSSEYQEYDSSWEILDAKIQSITYEQACQLDDRDIIREETVDLLNLQANDRKLDPYSDWNQTVVNMYMPKKMIMAHHLIALQKLYNPYTTDRTWEIKKMTEKELEDAIFMAMLMIDSDSEKDEYHNNKRLKALEIEKEVKHYEKCRSALFDQEE